MYELLCTSSLVIGEASTGSRRNGSKAQLSKLLLLILGDSGSNFGEFILTTVVVVVVVEGVAEARRFA